MNIIIFLIISLVLCAYFWSGSPKFLKENKQILLGVFVGLVLCKYFNGDLVEGLWYLSDTGECVEKNGMCRINQHCYHNKRDCLSGINRISQVEEIKRQEGRN